MAPVVTVAQRTKELESVGFARRKAQGFGYYLEGEQIDKGPSTLGESLRMVPGLRIGYDAQNQTAQKTLIMSSRETKGCVTYFIDGVVSQKVGREIEDLVRPQDVEALEFYSSATVPGEFAVARKSKCSVLVLWTKHKIHTAARSASP